MFSHNVGNVKPFTGRKLEIYLKATEAAKEKAKVIGACAWYECVDKSRGTKESILTPLERSEIMQLWWQMEGNTSWMDAFFKWMKGD